MRIKFDNSGDEENYFSAWQYLDDNTESTFVTMLDNAITDMLRSKDNINAFRRLEYVCGLLAGACAFTEDVVLKNHLISMLTALSFAELQK